MLGRAYSEYISRSYNTSTFRATRFDKKVLSHASAKKATKGLKGLKFHTFIGRFQWHHGSEGVKSKLLGNTYVQQVSQQQPV